MQTPRFQRGAVLFTALMFLIVVTLVALASIRSGVLELRMSLNDELSVSAFQQAQALADWVAANPAATPVVGDEDFMRCTTSVSEAGCDLKEDFVTEAELITAMSTVNTDAWANSEFSVAVQRTGSDDAPCPRGIGTTAVGTGCAPFRVRVVYDCTGCDPQTGGGRTEINEGVLVFVSTGSGR
ncbi:MAG: pilus assembly PilX N-terminal domain-containing protein [Gammaproteobacteria bacterium]